MFEEGLHPHQPEADLHALDHLLGLGQHDARQPTQHPGPRGRLEQREGQHDDQRREEAAEEEAVILGGADIDPRQQIGEEQLDERGAGQRDLGGAVVGDQRQRAPEDREEQDHVDRIHLQPRILQEPQRHRDRHHDQVEPDRRQPHPEIERARHEQRREQQRDRPFRAAVGLQAAVWLRPRSGGASALEMIVTRSYSTLGAALAADRRPALLARGCAGRRGHCILVTIPPGPAVRTGSVVGLECRGRRFVNPFPR